MENDLRQQIEDGPSSHTEGRWKGRAPAVIIGQQLKVTSKSTVLRLAETAIAKAKK